MMFIKSKVPVFSVKYLDRRGLHYSSRKNIQYGFIGLGQMGYRMALNLQFKLSASDSLNIFDINQDSVNRFIDETRGLGGAKINQATSVHKAAKNSKVTITVLPDPSQVKEVYQNIISPSLNKVTQNRNRLFIDCSTIDPTTSREIAKLALEIEGSQYVDAPMSGGVAAATKGSLTFMLGAPDHLVSQIERTLSLMGEKIYHCGPQASGLSGKLANNYLLAISNIATAEAMRLGIKWGLNPKLLSILINNSTGRCWPCEVNNPVKGVVENAPANRDYKGGFSLGLMRKDLSLAILGAKEAGLELNLGEEALKIYEDADSQGDCNGRDFSVIYRFLENKQTLR